MTQVRRTLFDRRTLLAGTGAFLLAGTGGAAAQQSADVRAFGARGLGDTDDSAAFRAAAASGATHITVPQGEYRLDSDVTFRNVRLSVAGRISGKGVLYFEGQTEVTGPGSIASSNGFSGFRFAAGGSLLVDGLTFVDCKGVAALFVAPDEGKVMERLEVRNCTFHRVNYGILRSGRAKGSIARTEIVGNMFQDVQGDAIELDLAHRDGPILIEANTIDTVDNTNRKPFWGIGIGLSGSTYTDDHDPATSVKNFVIRKNVLRNLRQGIHVECGRDFVIEDNIIEGISTARSPDSGLFPYGIIAYGCTKFTIQRNIVRQTTGGRAIVLESGVHKGRYISECTDFEIIDNDVVSGGVISSRSYARDSTVALRRNRADAIEHRGPVERLVLEDNLVTAGASPGFEITLWPATMLASYMPSDKPVMVRACGNRIGTQPFNGPFGRSGVVESCG